MQQSARRAARASLSKGHRVAATATAAIEAAVKAFGGIAPINNAGVMDGVFSGEPVDYQKQKPLVFAPIHEATEEYWSNVFRTNALGTFLMMRAELKQTDRTVAW